MLTKTEKGYLALSLFFLAVGSGFKAYRHAAVRIGPFPDPSFADSAAVKPNLDAMGGSLSGDSGDSGASGNAADGSPHRMAAAADTGAAPVPAIGPETDAAAGFPVGRPGNVPKPEGYTASAAKPAFAGKVNVNRAEAAELTHVKGIGEKTARSILDYRKSHGPFRDIRDL